MSAKSTPKARLRIVPPPKPEPIEATAKPSRGRRFVGGHVVPFIVSGIIVSTVLGVVALANYSTPPTTLYDGVIVPPIVRAGDKFESHWKVKVNNNRVCKVTIKRWIVDGRTQVHSLDDEVIAVAAAMPETTKNISMPFNAQFGAGRYRVQRCLECKGFIAFFDRDWCEEPKELAIEIVSRTAINTGTAASAPPPLSSSKDETVEPKPEN